MKALVLASLLLAAAYSLGAALLRPAGRLALVTWPRRLLVRAALGYGALAWGVLACGSVGLARGAVGWLLVLLALAAGAPVVLAEARAARATDGGGLAWSRQVEHPHWLPGGRWPGWLSWLAGGVLALLVGGALLNVLAPPVAYDDLTYHLAAPKIYAATGRVSILPWDHHTAFPFTLEMLYTLGFLLEGARLARLVQLSFCLLTLLGVHTLGEALFGRRTAWLAVLLYATTPLVWYQSGTAYTEFGFALYQLLAVLALVEYLNLTAARVAVGPGGTLAVAARQPQWAWLCGLFCGLTYGLKYTGLLTAVYAAGVVLSLGWRDGLSRRAVRVDLTKLLGVALLVALPWIVRTWAATGNPVFPFADGLFHSPRWSADRASMYASAQAEFGRAFVWGAGGLVTTEPSATSHRAPGRLLTVPWHLTFQPDWYYDRGLNFDGKAAPGPLWLALLPVWLAGWLATLRRPGPVQIAEQRDETVTHVYRAEFQRQVRVAEPHGVVEQVTLPPRRPLGLLVAHLLFIGLIWFGTMQYGRYLVPHLALWSLGIAWAADGLLRLRLSAAATGLLLALQLAGGLAYGATSSYRARQVATGAMTPDRFVRGALPAYDAMQWINAHAPEGTVALYGEPRGYWLDRPYLWAERGHSTLIPPQAYASSREYLDFLRDELGVRTLLINALIFPVDRTAGTDEVALIGQGIASGRVTEKWLDPQTRFMVYNLD